MRRVRISSPRLVSSLSFWISIVQIIKCLLFFNHPSIKRLRSRAKRDEIDSYMKDWDTLAWKMERGERGGPPSSGETMRLIILMISIWRTKNIFTSYTQISSSLYIMLLTVPVFHVSPARPWTPWSCAVTTYVWRQLVWRRQWFHPCLSSTRISCLGRISPVWKETIVPWFDGTGS